MSSDYIFTVISSSLEKIYKPLQDSYVPSLIKYVNPFYIFTSSPTPPAPEPEGKPPLSEIDIRCAMEELNNGLWYLKRYYNNPADKYLPEKFEEYQDLLARKNSVQALEGAIGFQRLKLIYDYGRKNCKLYHGFGKRKYERYSLLDYLCLKLEYINNEISLKIHELRGITSANRCYKWISPDLSLCDLEEKLSKYYNDNNPGYKAMKDLGLDMQYIDKLPEIYNNLICPINQSLMKEPIATSKILRKTRIGKSKSLKNKLIPNNETSNNNFKVEKNYEFDAYETGKLKFEPDVYEASTIRKWFIDGNNTSPVTRKLLQPCDVYNDANRKIMSMTKSLISEIDLLCNSDPEIIVKMDRLIEIKEELLDLNVKKNILFDEIRWLVRELDYYKLYGNLYPNKESIPEKVSKEDVPEDILEISLLSQKSWDRFVKFVYILNVVESEKSKVNSLM